MSLKSINQSSKKEIRDKSTIIYDFSEAFNDMPRINREINENISLMEARRLSAPKSDESKLRTSKRLVLTKK